MGAALWIAAGVAAFVIARIVPLRRQRSLFPELAVALGAAALLGMTATALDFGGWNEADWRAILFVFLGCAAALGALRAIRS